MWKSYSRTKGTNQDCKVARYLRYNHSKFSEISKTTPLLFEDNGVENLFHESIKNRVKRISRRQFQTSFNNSGGVVFQATMVRWKNYFNVNATQPILDQWINKSDRNLLLPATSERRVPLTNEVKYVESIGIEIPKTISCIELTMRHDKRGYVIGWMKGEPKTDNWNGSTDNQKNSLEKHVSKHGWTF